MSSRASGGAGVLVEDLRVSFAAVAAVAGIGFAAGPGEVLALVGGNGAGKSTTMRVLAGVVPAGSGVVLLGGVDVRADPLAAKQRSGYCPDVGGLLPRATPWEHLQLSATLRGLHGWERRAEELLDRFDLADVADRVTAGFSHGMGRRLSVVLAAMHQPPVLLLDEPFDGVDPLGVDATTQLVTELRAAGSTVLVSTHQLELAAQVAEVAVVLRAGTVAGTCPTDELVGSDGARRYRALLRGAGTGYRG